MQSTPSPKIASEFKGRQESESFAFKNNDFIDVRDMAGTWVVGRILEVNSEEMVLKIKMEGSKQESKYKFNSERIAPFRLYTKSINSHRLCFLSNICESDLENSQKRVLEFDADEDISNMNAFEITQKMRGELFYLIDSLVPQSPSSPQYNEKNTIKILCFFSLCVKMFSSFLSRFVKMQKEFVNAIVNQNAYLESPEAAYSLCIFEFLESLLKLFGFPENDKFQYFLKENSNFVSDVKDSLKFKFLPQLKLEASFQINNLFKLFKLIFSSYGGSKHVSQIIIWYKTDFPQILAEPPTNALIALWRLLELANLTYRNLAIPDSPSFKAGLESANRITFVKLKNISEKEIKEVDRELIMRMLRLLENNKTIDDKELETLELEIYKKYILSPYFEKKLKSLNDLKEFLERVRFASNIQKNNHASSTYKRFNFAKYFTVDLVNCWILENKILESALKNSTQIEILKRCQDIIKFIANHAKFPNRFLLFLWNLMEEAQYEDIKKGIQEILEELASLLDQDALDFLFQRIEEGLLENIKSEGYFSFLKRFFASSTIKTKKILLDQISSRTIELASLHSNNNEPENNESEGRKACDAQKNVPREEEEELWLSEDDVNLSKFFGIEMVWKLVQDNSPFSSAKINECLDFFVDLLKKASIKVLYRKYFELCLGNIFANNSIYQSVFLMREILNSIQSHWNIIDFSLFLNGIKEKYGANLIEIILKEMIENHQNYQKSKQDSSPPVFNPRFSYHEIYKMHLNLFQFLKNYTISRGPKSSELTLIPQNSAFSKNLDSLFNINYEHINILWELFVQKANDSSETLEFLKCFFNESSRNSPNVLKCQDYVFELFCRFLKEKIKQSQFSSISDELFAYFKLYYQQCNRNHRNFEFVADAFAYTLCEEEKVIGFETLWEIFLASEQEKINYECIQMLILVYGSLGIEIFPRRTEIFNKFLTKCLMYLKEAMLGSKLFLIKKILSLIELFIYSIEKKKYPIGKNRTNNSIFVKSSIEGYDSFYFNSTLPVKYLRLRISEINEISLDSFVILLGQAGMEVGRDFDEQKVIQFSSNDFAYCIIKEGRLESPKAMISEKKDFMQTFFEIFELNFKEEISNSVWSLISKLPVTTQMKIDFFENDHSNNKDAYNWDSFLTSKNIYKVQYYFQVFQIFFEEFKNVKNKNEACWNWFHKFKNEGMKHLLEIFKEISGEKIGTILKKTLLKNIVKALNSFMKFFEEHQKASFFLFLSEDELIHFVLHTLINISNIVNYSIYREENNLENCQYQKQAPLYGYPHYHLYGKNLEFFESEREILELLTYFLLEIFSLRNETINFLYNYIELEDLLTKGLLKSDNNYLKESLFNFMELIFRNPAFTKNPDFDPRIRLGKLMLVDLLKKTPYFDNNSDNRLSIFFQFYRKFFENLDLNFLEENKTFQLLDIFDFIYDILSAKKASSTHFSSEILCFLGIFLMKQRQNISYYVKTYGLINLIARNFIFSQEKNKYQSIFEQVISVLLIICQNSFENLEEFLSIVNEKMQEGIWRSDKKSSWEFYPNFKEKSLTGYVGLKNLGCICYMNSIFQQLYMIPLWRKAILEINTKEFYPEEENILKPLKEIFSALYLSDKQYVNPRRFCSAFRDENGNPICVTEQKDTFEFFSLFMEKLEVYLKDTPYKNLFKNTFEGLLSNQLICKGCPHSSEREEPFLGLNIEVKNKKNLMEGLEKFIESEVLEGDNAYYCEQCKKKVNTIKRVVVKKLPNHLMFVLKRFEFDFDTFNKVKLNDFYEFPPSVNMKPFTVYQSSPCPYSDEYFQYNLSGVIIHLGIADAGHYYSLIQDRYSEKTHQWIEFNDTNVKIFNENYIGNECFGYDEKGDFSNNNLNRYKNAYILIYDRKKTFSEETSNTMIMEESSPNWSNIEIDPNIRNFFENENKCLHINKVLFNKEFFNFFLGILPENPENKAKTFEKCQYVIDYFLFVLLRFWEKQNYTAHYFIKIKEHLDKNYEISKWFLKVMTDSTVLKEFFFDCPIHETRSYVVSLIKTAFHTVAYKEKIPLNELSEDGFPKSSIANFINCYISHLFVAKGCPQYLWHYFYLLNLIANFNSETAHYLLDKKIIARYYVFFLDKQAEKYFPDLEDIFKLKEMSDCPFRKIVPNEIKTGGFQSKYVPKKRGSSGKSDGYYSNSHTYLEYFWKTVADLIVYCKFNQEITQNPHHNYVASEIEIEFLKAKKLKFLLIIWESANSMKTARSIAKIYAYLSKEDEDFSTFLSKFYGSKIFGVSNENTISYLLKGLWAFLEKIEQVMDTYVKRLQTKGNNIHPKIMEIYFRFLLSIAYQNQFCLMILKNKALDFIMGYPDPKEINDVSKAEKKQLKMLSKKLESIKDQAWKLCHIDQNEALSEFDDCFDNDTSDGYEEHEEILF